MKNVVTFLLVTSAFCFLATVGFLVYHVLDDNRAGNSSAQISQILTDFIGGGNPGGADEEDFAEPTPLMLQYGEAYMGLISIPSLSLELPVNNELSDENLENSPCRYIGDISGPLIISAHNYRHHFANIDRLTKGDQVVITDMRGNEHRYAVELTEQLHESDIDGMINSPYDLTLFTCTLDNEKRITVRCSKISVVHNLSIGNANEENETDDIPDAPNYKIDYKNETLRLRKGDLYSQNGGESYTEIKQSGYTNLDVSNSITEGVPIYVKKGATNKSPQSAVQIIIPAPRAVLESITLAPENGKLTLGGQYEVYDARAWRKLPRITSDKSFDIRIKSTAQASDGYVTGNAASFTGTLIIKYGEYEPGKQGIVSAEIAAG
ncbi:MAG: sortase [Oscillospiraceae bacterium]|nr:sortase [Oscillospiraceae bacterium]